MDVHTDMLRPAHGHSGAQRWVPSPSLSPRQSERASPACKVGLAEARPITFQVRSISVPRPFPAAGWPIRVRPCRITVPFPLAPHQSEREASCKTACKAGSDEIRHCLTVFGCSQTHL